MMGDINDAKIDPMISMINVKLMFYTTSNSVTLFGRTQPPSYEKAYDMVTSSHGPSFPQEYSRLIKDISTHVRFPRLTVDNGLNYDFSLLTGLPIYIRVAPDREVTLVSGERAYYPLIRDLAFSTISPAKRMSSLVQCSCGKTVGHVKHHLGHTVSIGGLAPMSPPFPHTTQGNLVNSYVSSLVLQKLSRYVNGPNDSTLLNNIPILHALDGVWGDSPRGFCDQYAKINDIHVSVPRAIVPPGREGHVWNRS